MSEEKARNVGPARIGIAYERFGHPQDPPVLLLMGGGAQMIGWPDGFVTALAARGLQPIRFDTRDAGLSTHLTGAPPPDLKAALAGDLSSAAYTLSDMAADTVGLMDALGLDGAHLAGASLGGMAGPPPPRFPAPSWWCSRAWVTACPVRSGPSWPPASRDSSSASRPPRPDPSPPGRPVRTTSSPPWPRPGARPPE